MQHGWFCPCLFPRLPRSGKSRGILYQVGKILNSLPNVSEKSGNFILGWRLGSGKSFLFGKGNVVSKGMQLQSCGFMAGFIGKEFVFYGQRKVGENSGNVVLFLSGNPVFIC